MSIFNRIFKENLAYRDLVDLNIPIETVGRSYIKNLALQTVINFIARTFSQSEFRVEGVDNEAVSKEIEYRLNIRPNTDLNATDFWHQVVYKLIYDNEVLIIQNDTEDLLIADDFERIEFAVYPDTFRHVVVKDYEFQRSFQMDEVIYLNYNNDDLSRYVHALFDDYGEIFGQLIMNQKRKYQIRGVAKVNKTGAPDSQEIERLNKYIQKIYDSFNNNSIAIVPEVNGIEYEEINKTGSSAADNGMDNIAKMRKLTLDDVSKLVGIPPALIHGETADIAENMKAYLQFCINPLIKKIETELNNKLFDKSDYHDGARIKTYSLNKPNPLEKSEQADKLISSGAFTRNEIREMFGYEARDGLDDFLITKNYEEYLKGGDDDEQGNVE